MFKNYLSYQLSLSFHRTAVEWLGANSQVRARVIASAETLTRHFSLAIQSPDHRDEAKHMLVTLQALRDCRETWLEWSQASGAPLPRDLESQFRVLNDRIEQICWKLADRSLGQLQLIG
jgi:hypothetical protein